jgi:hypothetical protein
VKHWPHLKLLSTIARASISTSIAIALAALISIFARPPVAAAIVVSGSMVYQNSKPAEHRQLHFENRATGDMFIAPTDDTGNFSVDLPPGLYDLRAERGVILKYRVNVEQDPVDIGRVVEPVPLDVHRIFQHESVGEEIVNSPAPSTANLTGRPLEAMRYGHEAAEQYGAPVGTPVPHLHVGAKGVEGMPVEGEPSAAATGAAASPPPL